MIWRFLLLFLIPAPAFAACETSWWRGHVDVGNQSHSDQLRYQVGGESRIFTAYSDYWGGSQNYGGSYTQCTAGSWSEAQEWLKTNGDCEAIEAHNNMVQSGAYGGSCLNMYDDETIDDQNCTITDHYCLTPRNIVARTCDSSGSQPSYAVLKYKLYDHETLKSTKYLWSVWVDYQSLTGTPSVIPLPERCNTPRFPTPDDDDDDECGLYKSKNLKFRDVVMTANAQFAASDAGQVVAASFEPPDAGGCPVWTFPGVLGMPAFVVDVQCNAVMVWIMEIVGWVLLAVAAMFAIRLSMERGDSNV